MKKFSTIFLAIFAVLFTSCVPEERFERLGMAGTTTVIFTPDFGIVEEGPVTKAFTETPKNLKNLYLAVFSEGGKTLVEYVKADPVTLATANGEQYAYTATLKISNKPRVIHFIANAPEEIGYGSDVDVIGSLKYNFDKDNWTGEDAYWGYLKLDNGICKNTDPGYTALTTAMSSVVLVRNFAKIKIEKSDDSNLTITRFWISNIPACSTAAPYNREKRSFEKGYAGYTYASDAMDAGYYGFCPATAGLVSISGMEDEDLDDISYLQTESAYLYEREKPESDPICIIVGGTSNLSSEETFYKVEIRDSEGEYLPILRNFFYTITIGKVEKVGEPTVEAALNSVASGAIDTDVSLKGLKDLSNGRSRIAVSETERVVFDSNPFELRYSYIPDITTGEVVNKTLDQLGMTKEAAEAEHKPYVTIEFESGRSGNVIDSYSVSATDETDGYRKISMTPVAIGDIIKTEVVTITGHTWNSTKGVYETLKRTVTYQMRPRLEMTLALTPDRVLNKVGENLKLTIGIEENLPQSLFTLDLKITTEQMSLTPNSDNLPISSEVGVNNKPAFFMTRAITWEQYCSTPSVLDADGILRKHFDCLFKTNTSDFDYVEAEDLQGDVILVSNVNFKPGEIFFMTGDNTKEIFKKPRYDKSYLVLDRLANIIFGMSGLPSDGDVFVRMKGIAPSPSALASGSVSEVGPDTGENAGYTIYKLNVSNKASESFEIVPTSEGEAFFQLFDDEFNSSSKISVNVQKPGFNNLSLKYGDLGYVVSSREAAARFHMDYLTLNDAPVTIHLKNAVPTDATIAASGTAEANGYKAYEIQVTTNDFSFPVMITPASASETKAYFWLSATNYTNSTTYEATIEKFNFKNLSLTNAATADSGKDYLVCGQAASIAFDLDEVSSSPVTLKLTGLTLDLANATGTGFSGITGSNGVYQLNVTGTSVTLNGLTTNTGVTSAKFELSNNDFYGANLTMDTKTRYTIDWSKVLIKSDESGNPAQGGVSVSVYTTYNSSTGTCSNAASALGSYQTFTTTNTTGNKGYASATTTQAFVDAANGTDKFYFKFTKGGVDYISEDGVTLATLAKTTATTPEVVDVICKIQKSTYTVPAKGLYLNGKNGGEFNYTTSFGTFGPISVINGSADKGKNSAAFTIEYKEGDNITITWKKGTDTDTCTCTIDDIKNGIINF